MKITETILPFSGSIFNLILYKKLKSSLQHITLKNQILVSGKILDIDLSYQIFGPDLHSAPIILVNHALTGNSNVSGENGWWNSLIGKNKIIDTTFYSVICFNIAGNGFDGNLVEDDTDFITKDVANIFLAGLKFLNILHPSLTHSRKFFASLSYSQPRGVVQKFPIGGFPTRFQQKIVNTGQLQVIHAL